MQIDFGRNTFYNLPMSDNFPGFLAAGSEEERLFNQIDFSRIPVHVAIIMDGNGRWAQKRGKDRVAGHYEGTVAAREITECSAHLGIKYLTMFAFSSENWKRSPREIHTLMDLLYQNLINNRELLIENRIKMRIVGDVSRLPKKLKDKVQETEGLVMDKPKMTLNIALNYGSRTEIIRAIKMIIDDGISPGRINEKLFNKYLQTKDSPDPDLLIRTSGELRISNFLLYQIAYTELYFTPTLWPEFRTREFFQAIIDYQKRDRRFGKA